MISRRIKNWQPEQGRKLLSLLLLLSLFVSVIPVPVSLPVSKDTSEPFPCQDRPCGCRTAEQCRKQCCCFTKEQKIAWAKKRGLPTNCVVNDSLPQRETDPRESRLAHSSCHSQGACSLREQLVSTMAERGTFDRKSASSCCKSGNQCEREVTTAKATQNIVKTVKEPKARKFVIGLVEEKCRGGATDWNSLPWSVPALIMNSWKPLLAASSTEPVFNEIWITTGERPPVPPPRNSVC